MHLETAGETRKFLRNMQYNQSARRISAALLPMIPFVGMFLFIIFAIIIGISNKHGGNLLLGMAAGAVPRNAMRPPVVTFSADEWIADMPLSALPNINAQLPTQGGQIPNMRFIKSLKLWWEGRITNAGSNNPTGVTADGIFGLIDTIKIQGTHRIRGKQEQFINVRGPDLREWCAIYQGKFPGCYVSANGTLKNASALGFSGGFPSAYANSLLTLTASQTNDIRFCIEVPFHPLGIGTGQVIDFLLDAPNYDNLTLSLVCGDDTSVFTYGTRGAPTFTAYGSASGSPQIRVYGIFAKQGLSAFAGFVPARVFRWFDEKTGSTLTTTATGVRMNNINRGNKIRSLLFKTGTKSTTNTAGLNVYATLSDAIFSANIYFMQGTNKQIRFFQNYIHMAEQTKAAYGIDYDAGYALLDFARNHTVRESLNLRAAVVGASGDVDTYLQTDVAGAANQAELAMYEELYYDPSMNGQPYSSY